MDVTVINRRLCAHFGKPFDYMDTPDFSWAVEPLSKRKLLEAIRKFRELVRESRLQTLKEASHGKIQS